MHTTRSNQSANAGIADMAEQYSALPYVYGYAHADHACCNLGCSAALICLDMMLLLAAHLSFGCHVALGDGKTNSVQVACVWQALEA